ncbi:MAG: amino acid--[acyl-carrier-protein] ligase [Gemmatimonadales bacterium]
MGDALRADTPAGFGAALVAEGLLVPMGVAGLYGRDARLEAVIEGVDRLVLRAGMADGAASLRFPPTIPRDVLERSDYLRSFPHLTGTVHGFAGGEHEHAELLERLEQGTGWWRGLQATDVVLTPAACYPVYPVLAGTLPREGRLVDVCSQVFRREPSDDPTRLQAFRMHEQVCAGSAEQCLAHRDRWVDRGLALLHALEVPGKVRPANDPFFGRAGRMLASSQRELELKLELVVPIAGSPTACASFNYHQDHFGAAFGIRTARGAVAHTSCIGFGLERMALALLWHHGTRPDRWPRPVRELLGA